MTEVPSVPAAPGRPGPRWLWGALIVSLALNLLVVGMAAAAMIQMRQGHGGGFIRALPAERQAVLRPHLAAQRSQMRPLRDAVREARRRAREVLAVEPFDRARLAQAFDEVRGARIAFEKARSEWFLKLAETMTADERRQFVERRREREGRHRRWLRDD